MMARADPALTDALASLSASAMRRHGRTFFLASLLLGSRRRGIEALYRLCRHIDDIADDDHKPVEARRCALRDLDDALRREDRAVPWVRVALRLRDAHGLRIAGLHRLIEEAARDLEFRRPQSFDDLLRYAFGVAGVVGWMLCPMLGARDPEAVAPAVALGIGMQLTNIARDVVVDARIGRIYLPQDWAPRLSLSAVSVAEPETLYEAHAAALRLLDEAETFYALAERGMPLLPAPPRWSIRAAARMYREIGARVRELGAAGATRRAIVDPWRKSALLIATASGRAPRFARPALPGLPAVLRDELERLGAT
jgi:15-cis-phytoene synthase